MHLSVINEPHFLRIEILALEEELEDEMMNNHLRRKVLGMIQQREQRIQYLEATFSRIKDEEVAEMIRLYATGKSWEQVNEIVYHYPGLACRQRVRRYLERL